MRKPRARAMALWMSALMDSAAALEWLPLSLSFLVQLFGQPRYEVLEGVADRRLGPGGCRLLCLDFLQVPVNRAARAGVPEFSADQVDRCGNALMTSRTRRVEGVSTRSEAGVSDSASTSGSIGSSPSLGDIQSARS